METINDKVEEFFGVLLPVGSPLLIQAPAKVAHGSGADGSTVVAPKTTNKVGEDTGEDAIGTFPILLEEVTPAIVEKELGERNRGKKTLEGCIHVAGYSKVDQAGMRKLEKA